MEPVLEAIGWDLDKVSNIEVRLKVVTDNLIELLPNQYAEDFKTLSYISGGCIYSLYNDTDPKDYDFFLSSQQLADKLRKYFIDFAEYKGIKISGGLFKGLPLIITDNAISIGKYQIIIRWVGEPINVIAEFDFKHLMFFYRNGKIATLSEFETLESNSLYYNEKRARDIVGSIMRCNKFVARGMNISNKEMSKMLLKLNEVGFSERELEILRDNESDKHFGS